MNIDLVSITTDAILLGNEQRTKIDRDTAIRLAARHLRTLKASTGAGAPPLREMAAAVCEAHGIRLDELTGPRRLGNLVQARRDFIGRARAKGYSLSQIGRAINKDHTSILHAIKKMQETA